MKACGAQPTAITYNTTISACGKNDHWTKALQLMGEMRGSAIKPDLVTYNSCIGACNWEPAVNLMRDLVHDSMEPDAITYNAVIKDLNRARGADSTEHYHLQYSHQRLWPMSAMAASTEPIGRDEVGEYQAERCLDHISHESM